jgi:hypothetical protein
VQGEEYPIGRELFNQTYRMLEGGNAQPDSQRPTDEEIDQLWDDVGEYFALYSEVRETIRAALRRWGCQ